MNEMIKRRKDEGFTLIELMIVIAVIGILAIVLVPKVGSIKTQAKSAGVDTNARIVEGYVQSNISKWASKNTDADDVLTALEAEFTSAGNAGQLTNPFTSATEDADSGAVGAAANEPVYVVTGAYTGADATTGDTHTVGTVVLGVIATNGTSPITQINIYTHDHKGALIDTIEVTP